jgi:type VI secretion system protein ImpF
MSSAVRIRRSVFDRLTAGDDAGPEGLVMTYTVEQLRDAVARDLESLLNSRSVVDFEDPNTTHWVKRSVLCFGVRDFVGRVLSNSEEQRHIGRSLAHAIQTHEPRLRDVSIVFNDTSGSTNSLAFTIRAMLIVYPAKETVSFDAVLQPSLSRFAVMQAKFLPS